MTCDVMLQHLLLLKIMHEFLLGFTEFNLGIAYSSDTPTGWQRWAAAAERSAARKRTSQRHHHRSHSYDHQFHSNSIWRKPETRTKLYRVTTLKWQRYDWIARLFCAHALYNNAILSACRMGGFTSKFIFERTLY